MGRHPKYSSDEEKYKASLEYQNNYGKRPWKCESCNVVINYGCKSLHKQSKKHLEDKYIPWKCKSCNTEIHSAGKANHLKTKKHL